MSRLQLSRGRQATQIVVFAVENAGSVDYVVENRSAHPISEVWINTSGPAAEAPSRPIAFAALVAARSTLVHTETVSDGCSRASVSFQDRRGRSWERWADGTLEG